MIALTLTRIAWFSPLPPARSGIAAYSAELLPRLREQFVIDSYPESPESSAHDFVWRARRQPYDLVVYQLGNARWHDYMWAYLARYPGLVVLHDVRLHQARARHLLQQRRADDYRTEFRYDHPDGNADFTEYAVEGLGGSIYYFWSMLRVVMRSARMVAVHNPRVASDLRDEYSGTRIEAIRMGVPALPAANAARDATRRALGLPADAVAFAAFGKVTTEKRIGPILKALRMLVGESRNVCLLLVGDRDDYPALDAELTQHGIADRVRVTGHVDDEAIGKHLAAADACLCLRWPTALETSASWLRCLAAGRPTIITDLPHLVDIPDRVTLRVDLLDEERTLVEGMKRLCDDARLRADVGRAGYEYWAAEHSLDIMADDYRRLLAIALSSPTSAPDDLPPHFRRDYSDLARAVARQFGVAPFDF